MTFRFLATFALPGMLALTAPAHADLFQSAPDTLTFRDMALINFTAPVAPGVVRFEDHGLMPLLSYSAGGDTVPVNPKHGAYLRYSAEGLQYFAPAGYPTHAEYTSLSYTLVAYDGHAEYVRGLDDTPYVTARDSTVLGGGSLLSGGLVSHADGSITGTVLVSADIAGLPDTSLELDIDHAPGDATFLSATSMRLDGGVIAAHAIDEPSALGVLAVGMIMLGALRYRRAQ